MTEIRFKIHHLEQEAQLLQHRLAIVDRDMAELEGERKEHLQRLAELKKEIAAARRSYQAART